MLLWMIYVIVVSLILGGAALAAERSAHLRGAPTRWLWGASLIASLALPVAMTSVSIQIPRPLGAIAQSTPQDTIPLRQITGGAWRQMTGGAALPSIGLGAETERGAAAEARLDAFLTWGWTAAAGLMLLVILFNGAALYRRKRDWETQVMAGAPVFMSDDVGPAVVGLFRPRIVVPRWITGAEPQAQTLVVAHELSHLDAGDAQLLALAILLIVAMPWNLPLWWQLRRLRFAIEMDCDARVLRGGHDVAAYGETLVMVGERQSGRVAVVAAMSEPRPFLEQRIRKMLEKRKKPAWASATALSALGLMLAACATVVSPPNAPANDAAAPTFVNDGDMKLYRSSEWNFALDIPKTWNAFPAQPTNSPAEVIRFASHEHGYHLLIVFRMPNNPQESPEEHSMAIQQVLANAGFSHFVTGETRIGSKVVHTLDFDKPTKDGHGLWNCRHYFVTDGTLSYTLGFGTTDRAAMFDTFDKMAKSFVAG